MPKKEEIAWMLLLPENEENTKESLTWVKEITRPIEIVQTENIPGAQNVMSAIGTLIVMMTIEGSTIESIPIPTVIAMIDTITGTRGIRSTGERTNTAEKIGTAERTITTMTGVR